MSVIESLPILPNMLRRSSADSSDETVQSMLKRVKLDSPVYEGHVFKEKGSSAGIMKSVNSFNRRYFVLYPGFVLYYEHKRDYLEDLKLGMVSECLMFWFSHL